MDFDRLAESQQPDVNFGVGEADHDSKRRLPERISNNLSADQWGSIRNKLRFLSARWNKSSMDYGN